LKINQFANFPVGGISTEYEATQMVAMEFRNQISNAWIMIDDKYDENYFAVLCENGDANPDKSIIEEMYLPNRMKLLGFSDAAIRKIENFMFSKNGKGEDIESGAIVNVIIEEFYDNETPVLERYYKLLMILDDDFLCAEDIAGIEDEVLAWLRQDGKLSANQLSMSIKTNAYR